MMSEADTKSYSWMGKPIEQLTQAELLQALTECIHTAQAQHEQFSEMANIALMEWGHKC